MPETLYIIDGHSQIFRAYFAPFRPLSSPTGEPTKATYVFAQMFLNLIDQERPDYLIMVIDTGTQSLHRTQLYPQYKANRQSPPDDFHPQEQRILRMVQDAGVPVIGMPGYEADDVMATLTCRARERDMDVVLVSKDKDLRQLVTDRVVLFDPQSGKKWDAARVEAECGYPPEKAIEIQTLMGDAIDNVPGVPGVGEKTAAKLIRQYGSVDEIVKHAAELSPKLRENVLAAAHTLELSRKLVTLHCDVPVELAIDSARYKGVNKPALHRHFLELGFTNLLKRVSDEPTSASTQAPAAGTTDLFGTTTAPAPATATPDTGNANVEELRRTDDCDYRLVDTPELLQAFLAELKQQPCFAFDTETDALGAMCSNMVGMSFSWKEGTGYYLPVLGPLGARVLPLDLAIAAVKPILEDPTVRKCGHNIKYDALVLRKLGVKIQGLWTDSMVAAFVLDSSNDSYGIDRLAAQLLGIRKIATSELIGSGRNIISMQQVPVEGVTRYACEDVDICLRLSNLLRERLSEQPELLKLYEELENPLVDVLVEMEFAGVCVDPAVLRQQSGVLGGKIDELRRKVMAAAGCEFNPDSPKQLADVLFNRLGLPVLKRNKTGPSTDVEVLEKLAIEHELPRLALEHRSLVKLKNTYLDALTQYINTGTRRIHASFSQIGAETGRLSCNEPNLQNIPIRTDEGRAIRLAFVPQDATREVLLTADYSQIELRVLAHFTGEPALVTAFETDQDIHAIVAAEVFGVSPEEVTREQRNQAKTVNFGIIYGISAFGLARRIEGLSQQAAQKLIDAYHARFPSILKFMKQCVAQAKELGYVQTIMDRRRYLPLIDARIVAQRNAAERMAINSVIQGSAADMIKIAMLNIHRRIQSEKRPVRMLLQVHDELVFELPRDEAESQAEMIRSEMENAMPLRVPVRVSLGWGVNWQEGK